MEVAPWNLPDEPRLTPPACRRHATGRPGSPPPGGPRRSPRHVHPWSRPPGKAPRAAGRRTSIATARRRFHHFASPGTTRVTRRRGDCLAAPPLGSRRLLLAARSPPAACLPADSVGPRATGPPAAGVPELALHSDPRITSLGGVTPRDSHGMCPPPGGPRSPHTGSGRAISGARKRKLLPYHPVRPLRGSAWRLPMGLTGKPLPGLSWLSSSRSPFLGRSPAVVHRPDPPVARAGAPHASGVTRALTGT